MGFWCSSTDLKFIFESMIIRWAFNYSRLQAWCRWSNDQPFSTWQFKPMRSTLEREFNLSHRFRPFIFVTWKLYQELCNHSHLNDAADQQLWWKNVMSFFIVVDTLESNGVGLVLVGSDWQVVGVDKLVVRNWVDWFIEFFFGISTFYIQLSRVRTIRSLDYLFFGLFSFYDIRNLVFR